MTKYTPHRREWLEGLTPRQAAGVLLIILWAAVLLVAFCAPGHSDPGRADGPEAQRRAKCAYLWQRMAPWSYRPDLCEFFVSEHERKQIGPEWFFSLVYGYSGSDLKPQMVCRGGGMTAMGLMDGTELHLSRAECIRRFGTCDRGSSWVSIASHVAQTAAHHRDTGRDGWSLMRSVFLPARPDGARAWQEQRRWLRIAATMQSHLSDYYCQRDKQEARP